MLKLDQGLWVATVQSCYNMALQASTNVLKAEPRTSDLTADVDRDKQLVIVSMHWK